MSFSKNLFLLLSLVLTCTLLAYSQENNFCTTLNLTSKNEGADLKNDVSILKMRLSKVCGSCNVTESPDSKNIQACSKSSEKDLISGMLITAHGRAEFLETIENLELYPYIASIDSFLAGTPWVEMVDSGLKKSGRYEKFAAFAKRHPLFTALVPSFNRDENGKAQLRKGPVIGYCHANDTSLVSQMLSSPEVIRQLPENIKVHWAEKPVDKEGKLYELIAVRENPLRKKISNKNIKNSKVLKSEYSDSWEVYIQFDDEGMQIWSTMTRENIGKAIAICIDDKVVSYPTVKGEIKGGGSIIYGIFDKKEADIISSILNSGELISDWEIKN